MKEYVGLIEALDEKLTVQDESLNQTITTIIGKIKVFEDTILKKLELED